MELRYIGKHQPYGMIVDVEEKDVKHLIDSGDYELITPKKEGKVEAKNVISKRTTSRS